APWGWTWIDDAPWGYAPFHYGRWVFVGGGWGWVPGPVVVGVRPVYAPALVAWVGGPRFGVSVGIGGGIGAVGWFPLGPREVFVPSYRYSGAYIERVNVTNTVIVNRTLIREGNVTNVNYVNRGVPGAVVAVRGDAMVGGRPVAAAAVRVEPGMMASATIVTHAAVVPERGAVLGGREVVRAAPPAVVVNRTVVTRNAPPPAPVAFERQRVAMQSNPGRPLDRGSMNQMQGSAPRPMYRQAPAGQSQPQSRPQQPPRGGFAPQGSSGSQPGGSPAPRTEERRVNPQNQQQPRQFERTNPQPQPRSNERNTPREKQQERQKQERHEDRREREKEKS
ncbi:MAG: hypothetical protein LAO79_04265, partial [Acidobacteriia bacterium]|nr:hypothetical protein [Terriglobia bacterium]